MNRETITNELKTFIATHLIRDATYDLESDEGIITGGLIDSFSLAELAVFIEKTFNVYIPDPDLTVARMDTLDQIIERVLQG